MGSFEPGVLAAAPPTLARTHACLRASAAPGPRGRRARTGAARWPPGLPQPGWGLSRGAPPLARTSGTHGLPSAPKCCPGRKFKMPTKRLIYYYYFFLPAGPRRAAPVQVNCKCGAPRSAPAPRPRPRPRPRAPGAARLPSLAWGQGAIYGRRRGSGSPPGARSSSRRPRSPRAGSARPATYRNYATLPVPICLGNTGR